MGRNNYRDRRQIKSQDVYAALKQLNIKNIKSSWRDNGSEYGLICQSIGRKNTSSNRLRVRYIIDSGIRRKKAGTQKRQCQASNTDENIQSSDKSDIAEGNVHFCVS